MRIVGKVTPEILSGSSGNDVIRGRAGNDLILGNGGHDVLWGGKGDDFFSFSEFGPATIKDFKPDSDLLLIDLPEYFGDAVPDLDLSWQFATGGRFAGTGNIPIVTYNDKNGRVHADIDGDGAIAPIHIATVSRGLDLDKGDFFLYFN